MNRHVYNGCMAAGLVFVSVGAGMVYLPAGFITAGLLLIGFTAYTAHLVAGGRG
jgi:hypothetical protein